MLRSRQVLLKLRPKAVPSCELNQSTIQRNKIVENLRRPGYPQKTLLLDDRLEAQNYAIDVTKLLVLSQST